MGERELLERFAAVEVPPSRLTPETLLGAGRHRVFRRRAVLAGCGAVLAVGVLVAVPAFLPGTRDRADQAASVNRTVSCAVTPLATPAGMTDLMPAAVDPTGKYIVGNNVVGEAPIDPKTQKVGGAAPTRPVLWTNGQVTELPATVKAVRATDVNAAGVVVAVAGEKRFDSVLRYVNGVPEKLAMPPGTWDFSPYPRVNAGGDVMATVRRQGGKLRDTVVLLWKAGTTTVTELPLPDGARGWGLTDDGRIVGELWSPGNEHITPYVWDQRGNGTRLAMPEGQDGSVSAASGDWVAGNLSPSGSVVRWNLRTGEMTSLNLPAPANAINGRGWVIANNAVQRDGAVVTLAPPSAQSAGDPLAIADDGTVAGAMLGHRDGRASLVSAGPVTWRCPE